MQKEEITAVWERYKNGNATSEDIALLESWYLTYEDSEIAELTYIEVEARLAAIRENLPIKHKTITLWPRIATIAAAVAAIAFGIYFFNYRNDKIVWGPHNDVAQNDIAPGKQGATITLANGKTIQLNGAKKGVLIGDVIKYTDGTEIASNAAQPGNEVVAMTASTAKGQTYEFTLPDGTHVWLNADSKIEFPSSFARQSVRNVKLTGEAYFAVAHNSKQPFKVESSGQIVEDIGTEFNISAYPDESSIKTTLIEGSAKVSSLRGAVGNEAILTPNQQTILSNSKLKLSEANTEEAVAWKNGYFRFNDKKITEIMLQLSRWYDIEVKYEGTMTDEGIYGKISRYKNISDVLKMLEKTGLLHFKVEGRRVTVLR